MISYLQFQIASRNFQKSLSCALRFPILCYYFVSIRNFLAGIDIESCLGKASTYHTERRKTRREDVGWEGGRASPTTIQWTSLLIRVT
jgi:hypothetical protein